MPVLIPGLLPQHLLPSYSLSLTWCTENEKSKNTILSRRLLLVWLKNKGKQTNKHPLKSTTVPPVTVPFLFLHCAGLHKGKWKSKINTCDRWGNCCTDVCLSVCLSAAWPKNLEQTEISQHLLSRWRGIAVQMFMLPCRCILMTLASLKLVMCCNHEVWLHYSVYVSDGNMMNRHSQLHLVSEEI